MMRVFVSVVLFSLCSEVSGQSKCTVYQYPAGNDAEKKIVLKQFKGQEGHLLREEVRGFNNFLDNTSTMYCHREDGIYEYHYDDAQHYKTVITKHDERTGKPIDSDKVFYYYDSLNGRLTRELTVRHLNRRPPGKKPGGFRNACDIMYDNYGRVVRKRCEESDQFLSYDYSGRVLSDSIVFTDEKFNIVTRYIHESHFYKAIEWASDKQHPVVKCVTLDEAGKVISEAVCVLSGNVGTIGRTCEGKWRAAMNAGKDRMKEEERTEYLYDAQGRLRETHYYFGGRHTTTREYVYENVGAGEKMTTK
jgi:hypothetical protein